MVLLMAVNYAGDHEDLPFLKFCSVALAYQVNMGPKDILNTLLLTCLALQGVVTVTLIPAFESGISCDLTYSRAPQQQHIKARLLQSQRRGN